jgi:MscS family membrane protein
LTIHRLARFHGQVKRWIVASLALLLHVTLVVPPARGQESAAAPPPAETAAPASDNSAAAAAATAVAEESPPTEVPMLSQQSTMDRGLKWTRDLFLLRVGDNAAGRIIASFVVLLAAVVLRRLVIHIVFAFLQKLASRTVSEIDDHILAAVKAPASAAVLFIGVFVSLAILQLPPELDRLVLFAFKAGILVVVFWGFLRAIDVVADVLADIARQKDLGIATFAPLLKKTARFFFMVIGVILIIQNLGYSVGSLLAGLGIGGLAVALAAQDSIANFFGSVVVATDRPMRVGDVITIATYTGTVEEVGLRSTRLRTREKTLVTIPNKMMANEVIENFSAISRRRVQMTLGITYEATADQMESVLEDLRKVLREDESIDQDEMQVVHFNAFGTSSLDILVIFYAKTSDYVESLEVREKISLKLMRAVLARGMSFAFPTQTLYLEGEIARRLADSRGGPDSSRS